MEAKIATPRQKTARRASTKEGAPSSDVAKPYEPTPRERAALEAYLARKRETAPAPRMKVSEKGGVPQVSPDHPEPAFGQRRPSPRQSTDDTSLKVWEYRALMAGKTYSSLEARWAFAWDMNADGVFTISDIGALFNWLFFAPGDYAIYVTITEFPRVAIFLELSASFYGGWFSGILSGLVFIVGLAIFVAISLLFE